MLLDSDPLKIIPGDIWIATTNGSAFVTWDEPIFADNVRVEKVINKGGLKPGQVIVLEDIRSWMAFEPTHIYTLGPLFLYQALQWGTYDVAYVAYDEAGNTAQCAFKIYVLSKCFMIMLQRMSSTTNALSSDSFCPPLDPPQGGVQACEDWGPGGRFKVCRIACDEGLRFSRPVPQFYTCGAEGFWRPNPNAGACDGVVVLRGHISPSKTLIYSFQLIPTLRSCTPLALSRSRLKRSSRSSWTTSLTSFATMLARVCSRPASSPHSKN